MLRRTRPVTKGPPSTTAFRGRARPVRKNGPLEKTIQASILRWLGNTEHLYWRQNAGTLRAGKYRVRMGPKGIPDVIVILPPNGRFLGLEVKQKGRYPTPDQRRFQARLEAVGGLYKVVRSLAEAKEAVLEAIGAEKWNDVPDRQTIRRIVSDGLRSLGAGGS